LEALFVGEDRISHAKVRKWGA